MKGFVARDHVTVIQVPVIVQSRDIHVRPTPEGLEVVIKAQGVQPVMGTMKRWVPCPVGTDPFGVVATCAQGILTLTVYVYPVLCINS
jgi:hypothetical protein